MGGVKAFSCPNCGGQVELRAPGQSLSAVCSHCQSVIDTKNDNYHILTQYQSTLTYKPNIPLGTRGKLHGITWEVIGFIVREELKWKTRWAEYLLFNPWHGYAWLSVSDGHWNFIRSQMELPEANRMVARFENRSYTYFSGSEGKAIFVLGEFFWRLKADDTVLMHDFVCPPYILSRESNENEIVWSKGIYVPVKEVENAFGVKNLKPTMGVAPNQVNPYAAQVKQVKPYFWGMLGLFILAQIIFTTISPDKEVFRQNFVSQPGLETLVTEPFKIENGTQNLQAYLNADVNNDWFGIEGTLTNEETGENYGFYTGVEYYFGYEDGESWNEGDQSTSMVINGIPAGTYTLSLIPQKNIPENPYQFTLTLTRGVPIYSNFILILILISIYPIFIMIRKNKFETKRNANK